MVEGRPLPDQAGHSPAETHTADDSTGGSKARTCVGCGKKVDPRDPTELTRRVVLGPARPSDGAREVAIDVSSGGRGAHVHMTPACIRMAAEKGLRRSFKSALVIDGEPLDAARLASAVVEAEERRLTGMLLAAARSKKSMFGAEAVRSALRTGSARVVVVATDARAAADLTEVRKAVADGLAVAWGTKALLAQVLLGKPRGSDPADSEGIGVVAILDRELAGAIRGAVMAADSLRGLMMTVKRTGTFSQAVE